MGIIYSCCSHKSKFKKVTCNSDQSIISYEQKIKNDDKITIAPRIFEKEFYDEITKIIVKDENLIARTGENDDFNKDIIDPRYPNLYQDIMSVMNEYFTINCFDEVILEISKLPPENDLIRTTNLDKITIDNYDNHDFKAGFIDGNLESEEHIESLSRQEFSMIDLYSSLLTLISQKDNEKRCIFILRMCMKHQIQLNDNSQLIIQSFYHSNYAVLRFLVLNGISKIPVTIQFNDQERNFLVVLLEQMVLKDGFCILNDILTCLVKYYDEIEPYVQGVDNVSGKHLFFYLLYMYEIQQNQDLSEHLIKCLVVICQCKPNIVKLKFPIPYNESHLMDYIQFIIFMETAKSVYLLKHLIPVIQLNLQSDIQFYRSIFKERHQGNFLDIDSIFTHIQVER